MPEDVSKSIHRGGRDPDGAVRRGRDYDGRNLSVEGIIRLVVLHCNVVSDVVNCDRKLHRYLR